MEYISVKEASEKWGLGARRVRGLCQEGHVKGAFRCGRDWLIPDDAERPRKGKAKSVPCNEERLELYLNPTFCEGRNRTTATREEQVLCQATDLFFKGCFEEAEKRLVQLIAQDVSDPYLLVAQMTLCLVYAASNPDAEMASSALAEVDKIVERNPSFQHTRCLVECVRDERPKPADLADIPDKFVPVFTESICYLGVMDDLAGRCEVDPSCLEMLASTIDENEHPALSLYANIALALYHSLSDGPKLYDIHVRKSLEIALPRRWYAPLANYSYALDWHEVKEIDPEAYGEIQRLSATILDNYVKTEHFGKALPSVNAMTTSEFKVAYMSARGMSVKSISAALHISIYMVRKTLKRAYIHTGTTNREGLKALLSEQFKAI